MESDDRRVYDLPGLDSVARRLGLFDGEAEELPDVDASRRKFAGDLVHGELVVIDGQTQQVLDVEADSVAGMVRVRLDRWDDSPHVVSIQRGQEVEVVATPTAYIRVPPDVNL